MSDIVIFGASRGLGAALAAGVAVPGEKVWCISRTTPDVSALADGIERTWLGHDLAEPMGLGAALGPVGKRPVGLLVYNAGIWEQAGFETASREEIRSIVDINLTSLLIGTQALLGNLRSAPSARVVLIGSTCGLVNEGTTSVAYAATKFAVRGAGQALRELLRPDGIPVTVISPGSMATDMTLADGTDAALARHKGQRIPVADVVETVRLIRRLSPAACLKEIHMPAVADTDA